MAQAFPGSQPLIVIPNQLPNMAPAAAVPAEEREPTLAELLATLGSEQRQAVDWALRGYNMFVTGGAGEGKGAIDQRI